MERKAEQRYTSGAGAARAADALEIAALFTAFVVALVLCLGSLLAESGGADVSAPADARLIRLVVALALFTLLRPLRLIRVSNERLSRISAVCLMLFCVAGIAIVTFAQPLSLGDRSVLYGGARSLVSGEAAALTDASGEVFPYLASKPGRLGYLFYLELLLRLFGERWAALALSIIHVLLLVSGYTAALLVTKRLFADNRTTLLALLLLCVTPRALFSCLPIEGPIPAFAASLWAAFFAVRFMQTGRKREIAWTALCAALAVCLGTFSWIVVLAIAAALLVRALRGERRPSLLAAAVVVLACLPLPMIARAAYEARLDVSFGGGAPLASRIAAGLSEEREDEYLRTLYEASGLDRAALREQSRLDIEARLAALQEDPSAARAFYAERLTAQDGASDGIDGVFLLLMGDAGASLEAARGHASLLRYAGFLLAIPVLLRRRSAERLILPLALTGFVLARMLFGGGAGVFDAAPLLCPVAAYGIVAFGLDTRRWFVRGAAENGQANGFDL